MEKTWENSGGGGTRVCIHAKPTRLPNYDRILPARRGECRWRAAQRYSKIEAPH